MVGHRDSQKWKIFLILTIVASTGLLGLLMTQAVANSGFASTSECRLNVFYYLFVTNEPPGLLLIILMAVISPFFLREQSPRTFSQVPRLWPKSSASQSTLMACVGTFFLTFLGTHFAFHNYPLSMDEYMADFQAIIFSRGHLVAVLDSPWHQFANALTPTFCTYDVTTRSWVSGYLPVYAALRALFWTLNLPSVANPLLAAASVVFIAKCADRVLPGVQSVRVAVLLLITSSQFLITSMTAYSMPAHLLLNLVWLWLYSRNDRLGVLLTPWIGALALGLHNPFVHATFVAPFLIRIVLRRNWRTTVYFAIVYFVACLSWLIWMRRVYPASGRAWSELFDLSSNVVLVNQSINLSNLFTWQSFALIVLFAYACLQWGRLSETSKDLIFSFLTTFVFYTLFNSSQGHGWGYRYIYATLGNLALVATEGWSYLEKDLGGRQPLRWLVLSALVAIAVQLPIRLIQVERFTAPFERAQRYLGNLQETVVILDHRHAWYSRDLVRNDPFLRAPHKIMLKEELNPEDFRKLKDLVTLREVQEAELLALGLFPCHPVPKSSGVP